MRREQTPLHHTHRSDFRYRWLRKNLRGDRLHPQAVRFQSPIGRITGSATTIMRRVLLFSVVALAVGCDAISRTDIVVSQDPSSAAEYLPFTETDAVRVTRDTAKRFGLSVNEESGEAGIFFDDSVPGQNPNLYLSVMQDSNAVTVEVAEMYISSPTDKHHKLVESLMENFAAAGLDADIVYQTRNSQGWLWLLTVAAIILGLIFWWAARRRRTQSQVSNTEP